MKLSVIGCGYLGATHAACMSSLGFEVIGIDTDQSKVDLLSRGELPFYEPGLDTLLATEIKTGRLTFTTDLGFFWCEESENVMSKKIHDTPKIMLIFEYLENNFVIEIILYLDLLLNNIQLNFL